MLTPDEKKFLAESKKKFKVSFWAYAIMSVVSGIFTYIALNSDFLREMYLHIACVISMAIFILASFIFYMGEKAIDVALKDQ